MWEQRQMEMRSVKNMCSFKKCLNTSRWVVLISDRRTDERERQQRSAEATRHIWATFWRRGESSSREPADPVNDMIAKLRFTILLTPAEDLYEMSESQIHARRVEINVELDLFALSFESQSLEAKITGLKKPKIQSKKEMSFYIPHWLSWGYMSKSVKSIWLHSPFNSILI